MNSSQVKEVGPDHKSIEVDEVFLIVFMKIWIMFSLHKITCSFLFASAYAMKPKVK